jgi:hypothetical protein
MTMVLDEQSDEALGGSSLSANGHRESPAGAEDSRLIQTDLSKLGIQVSLATISSYLPKSLKREPSQH